MMDVAETRTAIMPSGEEAPEPEIYHAIIQGRKVVKSEALKYLKALENRKNIRVAKTKDPEEQRSARITAEASATLIHSLSPMKEEALQKKPMDVDVELAGFIEKGHAKQAALLES